MIREQEDLLSAVWDADYLVYKNKIVGFAAPCDDIGLLRDIHNWLTQNRTVLRAFVASTSIRSFTQKATALSSADIVALPYPDGGDLDLSPTEEILVSDIECFQRDLVRLGDKSNALKNSGHSALPAFNETFVTPINGIYTENPLIVHPHQSWPGIICQPYSFGPAMVDWSDTDKLRERLDALLKERQNSSLSVTRIARIYDGNVLYLIKPDRLRFWLRSVALRDADEVLADLRAQGF